MLFFQFSHFPTQPNLCCKPWSFSTSVFAADHFKSTIAKANDGLNGPVRWRDAKGTWGSVV